MGTREIMERSVSFIFIPSWRGRRPRSEAGRRRRRRPPPSPSKFLLFLGRSPFVGHITVRWDDRRDDHGELYVGLGRAWLFGETITVMPRLLKRRKQAAEECVLITMDWRLIWNLLLTTDNTSSQELAETRWAKKTNGRSPCWAWKTLKTRLIIIRSTLCGNTRTNFMVALLSFEHLNSWMTLEPLLFCGPRTSRQVLKHTNIPFPFFFKVGYVVLVFIPRFALPNYEKITEKKMLIYLRPGGVKETWWAGKKLLWVTSYEKKLLWAMWREKVNVWLNNYKITIKSTLFLYLSWNSCKTSPCFYPFWKAKS